MPNRFVMSFSSGVFISHLLKQSILSNAESSQHFEGEQPRGVAKEESAKSNVQRVVPLK